MLCIQRQVVLEPKPKGFHCITGEIERALPELSQVAAGIVHVYIQHTSASLTVNEAADPDVARDLDGVLDRVAPEDGPYVHTVEGPDDMPAHVKCSLMGASVSIPVGEGRLLLGTWQGVFLCEHRRRAGPRRLVVTLMGTPTTGS